MKSKTVDEKRVLKLYCNTSASIMNAGHNIIPSTYISKRLDCSLYRARKIIKSLVNQGLLESCIESEYSDYSEMSYIIRGYRLTQKGYESHEYKIAQWNEAKICSQVWGGTAYSWFKN